MRSRLSRFVRRGRAFGLATALAFVAPAAIFGNGAVIGRQEFAQLVPAEVRPGHVLFAGTVGASDATSFVLELASSWGQFSYRVARVDGAALQPNDVLEEEPVAPGKSARLVLKGTIDLMADGGGKLAGVFSSAGRPVRLQLSLQRNSPAAVFFEPTQRAIPYGPHWRQTIDYYRASTSGRETTPLLVFVHGGGWVGGDKSKVFEEGIARYLESGVSVASVNYRRVTDAAEFGIFPPVEAPMYDVARALQWLRHHANELRFDKSRVAISGGSAGACTSLWIAFHPDLAEPDSADPVARESTRVTCVAVSGAQTSLDPAQLRAWVPDIAYGGHAFGFLPRRDQPEIFQQFFDARDRLLPAIKRFSPYEFASPDDPPVCLVYNTRHDATHAPGMGEALKRRLDELRVPCAFSVIDRSETPNAIADFVIPRLMATGR